MSRTVLNPWFQAAALALLALALYVRTLAPTVMWYDMGEFQTAAYVLGIAHNTGYPLLVLLGKLFTFLPVGDVAYRVNLMSAAFGALTVGTLYAIVYQITARRIPAAVASLTLAVSSTLWSNATWATSYDLNAFLTLLILWLMLRWRGRGGALADGTGGGASDVASLSDGSAGREDRDDGSAGAEQAPAPNNWPLHAAALALGLGFGNHRLIVAAGAAAAYLACLHLPALRSRQLVLAHQVQAGGRRHRWRGGWYPVRRVWRPALAFLLGFSVNLYLPLRAAQDPPLMWEDASQLDVFLRMVTTGYARAFVNPFESLANLRSVLAVLRLFPAYEFTVAGLLLAALGAWVLWRRDRRLLAATGIVVGIAAAMISVYGIHNIFNYFQPIYLMLAIWLGVGAQAALTFAAGLGRGMQLGLLTEARRRALATALLLGLPLVLFARSYPILDRSGHHDARDFAEYLLERVEPGSVILADFWSWAPLRYLQVVDGLRPDVSVTNLLSQPGLDQAALTRALLAEGAPVYVALGIDDSPRLQLDKSALQLIAPNAIHYYPTSTLPLPQYKDLLIPKGSVYRALERPPELEVEQVPAGARLQAEFGDRLALHGFAISPARLSPGERFTAEYYWSLSDPGPDYWVEVQFTDEQQAVPTRLGLPIWLHSHWIGSEARPTSGWEPGRLMREVYDGLVPRSVPPGRYFVWATVYAAPGGELGGEWPRTVGDPQGVVLGTVEVVEG